MYCIECGAQILDNSKFCSHCGHKQTEGEPSLKEKLTEVIIEKEITRQVIEAHNSSIDKEFLKKSMGWYLAWVLLHLGCLLIGSDEIFSKGGYFNDFWPFDGDDIGEYDFREFLVYTIFPLAILVIWSMVRTQSNSESDETKAE
jgi:hypothetical protein